MPRRPPPLRAAACALAIALAIALAVPLAGCGSAPVAAPVAAVVAAPPDRPGVEEDAAGGSVTMLPAHANGALVVYLHGWGQDRRALLTREQESKVARALVAAGFTVAGADAQGKAWGDPASVDDYRRLIATASRRHGLHDVFLMGESMGGLATMQLAAELPAVRAVTAWYPVCDLRTMTADRFRESIDAAWQGLDRAAVSPVAASAKPMLIWASAADTIVATDGNAAVCAAAARARGATVRLIPTVGDHGDPSNFSPEAVVDFFRQHRTPAPGPAVSGSL